MNPYSTPQLEQRMSTVITAMRFPLIILVVFSHSLGFETPGITLSLNCENVYHFISELISHNFAKIAVCWFFVFSGYFFFKSLKSSTFTFEWIKGRWEKRFFTLVVPFLIWNTIPIIVGLIKCYAFILLGFGNDGTLTSLKESGPLYWFWTGPMNFPLWFMRDLIVMSLMTPLFYFLFTKFKRISLVALIVLYLSALDTSWPGFSMRAIFFFGVGAWFGIWKYNLLEFTRKYRVLMYYLAPVTLILATFFNSSPYHEFFLRIMYPCCMIVLMNFVDHLINKDDRKEYLVKMSSAVFFIYVTHEILILGWTKGLCLRIFGDSIAAQFIRFFLVPLIVLFVCVVLYNIINRYFPRFLSFLMGGRISK